MSRELTNRLEVLKDRSLMLAKAREFFHVRDILEVDVPVLSKKAPVDLHIDLITAEVNRERSYLNSSPEYGMKRLLVEGMGDIYQISHVFRDAEVGQRHNPEFVMVEWYRLGFTLEQLMEETLSFARLFLDEPCLEKISYSDAFLKYAKKSYLDCDDRDYVFAFEVESKMQGFTIVYDFPSQDAALAKVEGEFAKRFELYYNGVELANGYDELQDHEELKNRFVKANAKRKALGKPQYPIDHDFLLAIEKGLPSCAGVAVGFDRLMMLRHKAQHIKEVIAIAWS